MSDQGKSPIHNQHGRSPLARDSQQWLLDYLIQETGKPQRFQGGRGWYPKSIQTHAMISKHLGADPAARRIRRSGEGASTRGNGACVLLPRGIDVRPSAAPDL